MAHEAENLVRMSQRSGRFIDDAGGALGQLLLPYPFRVVIAAELDMHPFGAIRVCFLGQNSVNFVQISFT